MFVSTDGGEEWRGQSPFDPFPIIEVMVVTMAPDGRMLAADNQAQGIARGDGRVWDYSEIGLPWGQGVRALAFAPSDPAVAYAGIGAFATPSTWDDEGLPGGGILRSDDGGRRWTAINDESTASAHVASVAVDPHAPDRVFAATINQGLLRTTDGGESWQSVGSRDDVATFSVAIHPDESGIVLSGSRAGIFRSTDGGDTFERVSAGTVPEAVIVDFEFDPTDPDIVYAADLASGVYRSDDGGGTWSAITKGLRTRAVNDLAVSLDGRQLYAATEGEGVYRLDLTGDPPEPLPTGATTTVPVTDTTMALPTTTSGPPVAATTIPALDGEDTAGGAWPIWAGASAALLALLALGYSGDRHRRRRRE
jgi:photosystem II stability/assembly factor-like uncharacterized protein